MKDSKEQTVSGDETTARLIHDFVFMRCNTCFKQVKDSDPHVVAHKNGTCVVFCKEHAADCESFLRLYEEFITPKEWIDAEKSEQQSRRKFLRATSDSFYRAETL